MTVLNILRRVRLGTAFLKCMAVLLAYVFGFYVTRHFREESGGMGAVLACTSAIVVLQDNNLKNSLHSAWLRVLGTFIGAFIAWIYLLFYPFSVMGMIVAVFVLGIICMLLKVPDDGKMATITLTVVLVVSQKYPGLPPWENGLLRFSEAAVGAGIGIFMVWLEFVFSENLETDENFRHEKSGIELSLIRKKLVHCNTLLKREGGCNEYEIYIFSILVLLCFSLL